MTPREELANLLSEARKAAGYSSQAKYAKARHVSRPLISRAESATQPPPSADVIKGYVGIGAGETEIKRLIEAITSGTPAWFVPYLGPEAQAIILRCWSPILVPGLLQTENYARAVLAVNPHSAEKLAELIKTRMDRKQAIGRAYLIAVIDHLVLQRCLGSPAVMTEQCGYLADLTQNPQVALHVVPEGVNMGLFGAFDIATGENKTTVRLETAEDIPTTAAPMVSKLTVTFERILDAAMPCADSLTFVRTMEEQWKARM
jgi:hypothetical protein